MARVDLPASRVRAKRRRQQSVLATFIVVALLLVFGGLVWLSHASFLRITAITVSGDQTLSDASVQSVVQSHIMGSYGHLFAKNNIFLYPKSSIETALTTSLPVIASADVQAVNFHTIGVTIIERQPKALWCGVSAPDAQQESTSTLATFDDSGCLLLDQNGVAYAPASPLSMSGQANAYKRYYGQLDGTALPKQYLTPTSFSSLGALVDTIGQNQSQDTITAVLVDQNGDVHVSFASGFTLLFTLSADGGDVYSRFQLALESDAFAGHTIGDFQYLDLRFGDRLYYKVRDAETPIRSN